ncbi:MAG TPA: fatty acid desaturase [Verrucomicrobiae bacterium]|nr:fatty acid desaturase [Verrucomicrobiae bacterium]
MGLAPHLHCFVLPVTALAFLASAPHAPSLAFPWLLVLVGSIVADVRSRPEHGPPPAIRPGWPFDGVLYVLAALQAVNIGLLVRLIAHTGFWRADTLVALILVGVNSGYSALVVAHELIHRPRPHQRLFGRALLCSVLYEHFFTEHLRGHHVRVGTTADPATAHFGETAFRFLLRTVPAQFRSAWRLEAKRLGDEHMRVWDRRMLRSRVVHGLAVEWGLALAILAGLGAGAAAIFVLQAALAVRLLEAVNYFEHWGLARSERRIRTVDSWDADSRFTLYTLVGLARHSDHHVEAARPYQQLRFHEESPQLPYGYFGTVVLAIFANRRFRARMTAELERRRLGPFAAADDDAA